MMPAATFMRVALARLLADKLSGLWGRPVLVENKAGGNGIIVNLDVIGGTPAQLTAHLAAERRKFAAVIKVAGVRAE